MRIIPENQGDSIHGFTGDSKFSQVAETVHVNHRLSIKSDGSSAYAGQWSQTFLSLYFLILHFISLKPCLSKLFPNISNIDSLIKSCVHLKITP